MKTSFQSGQRVSAPCLFAQLFQTSFRKLALLCLVLLCVGGSTSAQMTFTIDGPTETGAPSTREYYLVGTLPPFTYVTWTAVGGQIVGESYGLGLNYTYVYWPDNFVSGSLNATTTGGTLSTTTITVHKVTGFAENANAIPTLSCIGTPLSWKADYFNKTQDVGAANH